MDPAITSLGIPAGLAGWNILQTKTPSDFPALTKDPVLRREISYFKQNAPKASTAKALLSDPRLQDFVLTAYGLSSESGMTALMTKVLNSNPNDKKSFAAQMVNAQYLKIAADFNYGGTVTPAIPATASHAEVAVSGLTAQSNFQDFSGKFGGVSIKNADLTGVASMRGLADSLQTAFRQADGNRSDISVTYVGDNLEFSDAKGRGTASGFTFDANVLNSGGDPAAAGPDKLVAGAKGVPPTGGPAVTSSTFINKVIQKYQNAQFQVVVGNQSNVLREALYAKQQLPSVTSWYQVIADKPLANVVQTLLGLPVAFGALNVDQQVNTLRQRMNINDFQTPSKVAGLLKRFVAMGSAQARVSPAATAATLLDNAGSANFVNLTLPSATGIDTFSSGSAAALVLSTAFANR